MLPRTLVRLHAAAQATGLSYEIVLVDDGSRDRTWEVIAAEAKAGPQIRGVRTPARNFGHQMALTAGLERARGAEILIIDADLQDPPELLGVMLAKRREGYDIVYGQRRSRAGETWFKRATARLFYRLIGYLAEVSIPPDTGDFRLMSRRAVNAFLLLPENSRFIRGMVAWIGYAQTPVLYDRDARAAGKTKYNLAKMLRFSADAVTGFSIKPLRVASFASAGLLGAAFVITVWALLTWASNGTVRGWTSLIVTILWWEPCRRSSLGSSENILGRLFTCRPSDARFIPGAHRYAAGQTWRMASASPLVCRTPSAPRAGSTFPGEIFAPATSPSLAQAWLRWLMRFFSASLSSA